MSRIVSAPSNIALIKYMGKSTSDGNIPTNSSLSYTLKNLKSFVRLEKKTEGGIKWAPLKEHSLEKIQLSEKGLSKFIRHFQFLKEFWKISDPQFDHYLIESANNFPSDCGLASSASSFAALTMAVAQELKGIDLEKSLDWRDRQELALLSSKGSGSSCRSFFSPWGLWSVEGVCRDVTDIPYQEFTHLVVIVEEVKKAVSSSEAHQLVIKSSSFLGRPERAERRLMSLLKDFKQKNWKGAFKTVWDEFMDMHDLFHNCEPSFSYMTKGSKDALKLIQSFWEQKGDGPLVTMDAGANVHLLFRSDFEEAMINDLKHKLNSDFKILDSRF